MFTLYVLRSKRDNKLYIGSTNNLSRRLNQHMLGLVKSTKNRRPLVLVYKEDFELKQEASQREKYFKGGGRARKLLDDLIANNGGMVQWQNSGLQNR